MGVSCISEYSCIFFGGLVNSVTNVSWLSDIYQRRELHSVNTQRRNFSHEKRKKNHLLKRAIGKYLQISLRSALLRQKCKGYSACGICRPWAVLLVAALQIKPLVIHTACSSSLRSRRIFPLKHPQQFYPLLVIGPWPSYLPSLSFHFCICKIEQSSLTAWLNRKCFQLYTVNT